MSKRALAANIKTKALIKDAYLKSLRSINHDATFPSEQKSIKIINTLISTLDVNEDGVIKNTPENKKIAKGAVTLIEREFTRYRKNIDKALTAVGLSAGELHQELKKVDAKYLGKDRYSAFTDLDDEFFENISDFHQSAMVKNSTAVKNASKYIKNTIRDAILFNISGNALTNKLINNGEHLITDTSSVFAESIGNINDFSGRVLNFYTEVPRTTETGYREVFNSNPMDERTKPICAAATVAGVIPVTEMERVYGVPPRMICRCDLVWVRPEWTDVKADVTALVEQQRKDWRSTLIKQPKRKDGNYYASVSDQLKVLDKKYTPAKFEKTALHTSKMRVLGKEDVKDVIKKYRSTYTAKYGVGIPTIPQSNATFLQPPIKTAIPSNRIDAAYAKLAKINMYDVDLMGADAELAEVIVDGLSVLSERGQALPSKIRVPDKSGWLAYASRVKKNPKSTVAAYSPVTDTITFNAHMEHQSQKWWLRPKRKKYTKDSLGWASSNHPHHIVYHEVGHKNHFDKLSSSEWRTTWPRDLSDKERTFINNSVSGYATTSHKEFVSEVYAGMLSGISYDDKILKLYKRLKGPKL